jgi:hypothetical protein
MAFEDWSFRKEVVIDSSKVDGTLTDFPVVVHLKSDSDLAANAQPSGDDIAFVASDETTQLSHEIEAYNGSTGTLWAHVKLPSLSATTDTELYIYYGNPEATNQESVSDVWTNNFEAVYHLTESSSGTGNPDVYKDSTSNGHDLIDNVSAGGKDGLIASGQRFDGSDDFIVSRAPFPKLDLTTSRYESGFTVSAQFNASRDTGGRQPAVVIGNGTDGSKWQTYLTYGSDSSGDEIFGSIRADRDQTDISTTKEFDTGKFHYAANVWDSSVPEHQLYVNGELKTRTSVSQPSNTDKNRFYIGKFPGFNKFGGAIDEVRVVSSTRSSDFLSTTHQNQVDPLSFRSVGPQESIIPTKEAVASAAGTTTADAARSRSVVTPTKSTSTVEPVSPGLREQRTQSVGAETAVELGTTLPLLSLTVQTPLTTAATTTAVTGRELFTAAVNSQTTAVETQTRFFKFAAAQATASTQAKTGARAPTIDAPADVIVSLLTRFNLEELTQNRRSIEGTDNIDAAFQTLSGDVEYDELPDDVEFDS